MIELLSDMPDGVTGIKVSGKLAGTDIEALKPDFDDLFARHEFRLVEVVEDDYAGYGPGGLTEDLKFGLGALIKHHAEFRRIAFVTDLDWARHTVHAIAWLVPGELKTFTLAELQEAKEWAAG